MGNTFSSEGSRKIKQVYVHFEGKKLQVVFADGDYDENNQIAMSQFIAKLSRSLNVPSKTLQLYQLHPQKRMGNLKATLEDYGIANNGELLAVQNSLAKGKASTEQPKPPAPKTPTEQIDAVVKSVETEIGDRMKAFLKQPPSDPAKREQENRVLCEIVLAKLISLDNVEVTNPEERQTRKQAISKLQGFHAQIDEAMQRSVKQDNGSESGSQGKDDSPTPSQAKASGKGRNGKKKKKGKK